VYKRQAKNRGMFFFAMEDDSRVPVAATAISFKRNALVIHFYWYGCEQNATVRIALFREVNSYCIANSNQVSFVHYPVPIVLFDKKLVKYFMRVPDEYERLILWNEIPYNEFMLGIGAFSRRKNREDKLYNTFP